MSDTQRPTRDQMYLRMAFVAAARSTCTRRSVGAVAVSLDGRKIALGYNGNAHDQPNGCDHPNSPGLCGCVHAEANALLKADFPVGTLYVTCTPCLMCAKMIVNAHVVRVVCAELYRDDAGLRLLREADVTVVIAGS